MLLPRSIVRLVLLPTLCSQCPRVRRIFAVSLENLFELGPSIYDRNACPADACKRTKPNRTRGGASVDSGLIASHSASTAGHLPSVWSHATDGLEVLQSMRDKAPMPHL